jgi:hypothetical protein
MESLHDVPAMLEQPGPWGLAAGPQVLDGGGLGGPQEVDEAPSGLTGDPPLHWHHGVGVGDGDGLDDIGRPAGGVGTDFKDLRISQFKDLRLLGCH